MVCMTLRWRGLDSKFQYAREFVPVDAARTTTATRFSADLRPSTRIPAIIRSRMARRSLSRATASIGLSASPTAWASRPWKRLAASTNEYERARLTGPGLSASPLPRDDQFTKQLSLDVDA